MADGARAIHDVRYEGYGPGGVAVLIDCDTQDGERTGAELRRLFASHGGHLGAHGSVSYLFNDIGLLTYAPAAGAGFAELARRALAAGAEDVQQRADALVEVITDPPDLPAVRGVLERAGYTPRAAGVTVRAAVTVGLDGEPALALRGLLQDLRHCGAVRDIHTNARLAD